MLSLTAAIKKIPTKYYYKVTHRPVTHSLNPNHPLEWIRTTVLPVEEPDQVFILSYPLTGLIWPVAQLLDGLGTIFARAEITAITKATAKKMKVVKKKQKQHSY